MVGREKFFVWETAYLVNDRCKIEGRLLKREGDGHRDLRFGLMFGFTSPLLSINNI